MPITLSPFDFWSCILFLILVLTTLLTSHSLGRFIRVPTARKNHGCVFSTREITNPKPPIILTMNTIKIRLITTE